MLEHEMEAVVFSKSTLAVTDPGFFCEGCANSQVRCAKHYFAKCLECDTVYYLFESFKVNSLRIKRIKVRYVLYIFHMSWQDSGGSKGVPGTRRFIFMQLSPKIVGIPPTSCVDAPHLENHGSVTTAFISCSSILLSFLENICKNSINNDIELR